MFSELGERGRDRGFTAQAYIRYANAKTYSHTPGLIAGVAARALERQLRALGLFRFWRRRSQALQGRFPVQVHGLLCPGGCAAPAETRQAIFVHHGTVRAGDQSPHSFLFFQVFFALCGRRRRIDTVFRHLSVRDSVRITLNGRCFVRPAQAVAHDAGEQYDHKYRKQKVREDFFGHADIVPRHMYSTAGRRVAIKFFGRRPFFSPEIARTSALRKNAAGLPGATR